MGWNEIEWRIQLRIKCHELGKRSWGFQDWTIEFGREVIIIYVTAIDQPPLHGRGPHITRCTRKHVTGHFHLIVQEDGIPTYPVVFVNLMSSLDFIHICSSGTAPAMNAPITVHTCPHIQFSKINSPYSSSNQSEHVVLHAPLHSNGLPILVLQSRSSTLSWYSLPLELQLLIKLRHGLLLWLCFCCWRCCFGALFRVFLVRFRVLDGC